MPSVMRNHDWTIWIVPGFFLVWLITYFVLAKEAEQVAVHLRKNGVLTSGVIEGRRISSCSDVPCHLVAYRFALSEPKGKTQYRNESYVSEALYDALKMVRFVDVRYLKDDPHISCLEVECSVRVKPF